MISIRSFRVRLLSCMVAGSLFGTLLIGGGAPVAACSGPDSSSGCDGSDPNTPDTGTDNGPDDPLTVLPTPGIITALGTGYAP